MRTGELTHKILSHYGAVEGDNTRKYITLTQVRASTGYGEANTADVLVMGNWPSSGNELEGFEVKISRSDWLNEVGNVAKSRPIKKYCDRFWLVIADATFVRDGELPDDWGMMAVENGELKTIKPAPKLEPEPLSNVFVASMLRSDATETVPIDVHNDYLKDAVRDAEAAMKDKYKGLIDYVKFLHKELGIELKWQETFDNHDRKKKWVANLNKGYTKSPEELVTLIKAVMSKDFDSLGYEMYQMVDSARDILKIAEPTLRASSSDWRNR